MSSLMFAMKEKSEKNFRKINSERLVLAVQKYPVIWKSSLPEYKDKKVKWDAWNKVAAEIVDDWSSYNLTETQTALEFLMRRWHNIRDYYIKIRKAKHLASLRGEKYYRKHMLNRVLQFLKPEVETKILGHSKEGVEKEELEEVVEESVDNSIEEEDYITFVDTLQDHTYDADQVDSQEMDCATKGNPPSSKNDDPDLMFLKSLLPDMKRLQDDEKFEFKYAIMQAYKNIISKRNN